MSPFRYKYYELNSASSKSSYIALLLQAGSDAVLGDMRREYTVAEFSRVVDFLKERVEGLTIVTDIIAGFPTETHEDWEETMDLCRKYKFPRFVHFVSATIHFLFFQSVHKSILPTSWYTGSKNEKD